MRRHFSALLALATLSRAWRAEFLDATQCGTVTVTWSGTTAESIGPPFVVRVAPFGLAPLTFNLSETAASAWNAASRTGSYSFAIPWPAGTRFISVMDDGFGLGTGGVSGIQTVKSSSNSTCIDSSVTEPRRMFDINSSFAQCSQVSMNWTEPATSQTRITGLVPNGVAFQLDPPRTASRSTSWDLNIESGTAFVLIYNDGSGNGMTSPLLQSLDSSIRTCLASGAYPSATASQTGVGQATATESYIPATSAATTATSTPESANSGSRSNLGPILGAVLGTLALLGALGVGVWILRRRRKRVVPQTAEFGAKVDLDTQNTQPGHQFYGNHSSTSPRHPGGPGILPFVLPYNGSYQQENSQSNHSRKRPLRDTPADIADVSDSSHDYTTGTSVSQSAPPPREDVDEEPMIIQHEDAGALIPPRPREVIELPPGYDQLPRPQPPAQAPQQARPRPLPQPK